MCIMTELDRPETTLCSRQGAKIQLLGISLFKSLKSHDGVNSWTASLALSSIRPCERNQSKGENAGFFLEARRREKSEVTRKKWLNTPEQARTYVAEASISTTSAPRLASPSPFIRMALQREVKRKGNMRRSSPGSWQENCHT